MAKLKGGGLDSLGLPGKIAIGMLFLVIIGGAYLVIFYSDIEKEIEGAARTIVSKKQELKRAEEAKLAYNKDLAEKARREQLVRKQKKILPDDAESPAFLSTVQTIATISGVRLTKWKPLDERREQFYARVPMALTLNGKYHQIAKFFNGVSQADRIINIENIKIILDRKSQLRTEEGRGPDALFPVTVSCLATAFRALSPDEGRRGRKKGKKGRRK